MFYWICAVLLHWNKCQKWRFHCIGATILTRRESQCLPYLGFFLLNLWNIDETPMDAFMFPLARQPLLFKCKRTISMNILSYLVAGLAVWRMIRNQYWSLLILCQISVENHPAWKLKKTQPPKLVHRSPRWQMKVIELRPYFCQKIFFSV